jgi:hypothetical protein
MVDSTNLNFFPNLIAIVLTYYLGRLCFIDIFYHNL